MTPVRAMPRPSGGSGSSRTTVTWPTRTPANVGDRIRRRRPRDGRCEDRARAASTRSCGRAYPPVGSRPWRCRSRSCGPTITGSTSRRPRSGSASGRRPRSCPRGRMRSVPRCSRPGADEVAATPHDDAALEAVHDPGLLAFLASAWADWEAAGLPDDPGPGPGRAVHLPAPGADGRARAARAGGHLGAAGCVLLRHDDADRPGYLGGGARGGGRGAHGGRSRRGRRAARLRLLPAARASRHPQRLRRLVLPQQRRDRGAAAARSAARRGSRSSTSTLITGTVPSRSSGSGTTSSPASVHIDPATGWFPHFLGGDAERGGRCGARLEPQRPAAAGCAG